MQNGKSDKVLIFVVAYNADRHIRSVLDRLPREVINNPGFHILIIDDCSKDNTAKTASEHAREKNYLNVTVMRNPINQGYGGNQKLGYRYAIENGYGLAILLHGDGQYAPELVLEFVKRWREGAQVILGSRMLNKAQARAGGMPLYKWVGNQILTTIQNKVVGGSLSEFHTGYRAYDTQFLSQVPFELNTNDFHFDTEILLQAYACNAKINEFAIPTHYGDEICHVNGMKYAGDVIKSSFLYRFQKIGFFCSMRYQGLLREHQDSIGSAQFHVLEGIKTPARVLNMSTSSEQLSERLRSIGCKVVSLKEEPQPQSKLPEDISQYDYVLVLNRMERLSDAERFLVECRFSMGDINKQPKFVFSTGNVAFIGLRVLLALGLFNYGERGILRVNNKRLFTLASFRRLLRETGYKPGRVRGLGVPFHLLFSNSFGRFLSFVSDALARLWPSMFAYQFLIEAAPQPHTFSLLSSAERFYETRATSEM